MSTTTLQVRLDHQLKKDADQFFSSAGLDTTTAVRMFLRQVLIRKAIPFDIVADDPLYGEGLGLDSIDMLELSLVISKRYGFQLRSDNDNKLQTFSSLRALCQHIAAQRTP